MRGQVLLIAMLTSAAAVAQVAPSATGGPAATPMATPPPISGVSYPMQLGSEVRANYLRAGVTYTTSYIDNLYAGSGNTAIAETTLSILPTIAFDASASKQRAVVTYSPGFTFYRPSSELDEVDNTAAVNYDRLLSPHTTVSAIERFQDSSSPFSPADAELDGSVTGTPESFTPGVVPPFAKRLTNFASVEIAAQTGPNTMIGASGLSATLHYPDPSQAPGLYDSNSRGGTAFYNARLSPEQYVGVTYQYLDMLTTPTGDESTTKTSTVMGYYSIYPAARLSLSVAVGPQYYQVTVPPALPISSWAPSIMTSMGWQGDRMSVAASYSQSVTGGGGLIGAFHSRSASAAVRWQLAREWMLETAGSYFVNKSVDADLPTENLNGHSLSGSATLRRSIGKQVSLALDYDRIHQDYGEVPAISANPNADRVSIALTWNFMRPLGR